MEDLDVLKFKDQLKVFIPKHSNITDVILSMKSLRTLVGKQPEKYQEAILAEEENILTVCQKIIECYNSNREEVNVDQFYILLEFLHNLCVGQKCFSQKLWNKFGRIIYNLVQCESDTKLSNLLTAVILQMIKNDVPCEGSSVKIPEITKLLLQVIANDEIQFALLAIQELLRNHQTGFCIETIYSSVDLPQRYVLLDIIAEEKLQLLDQRIVHFLVTTFKHQSTILMTILEKREDVAEPREMLKILNILGCISHLDEFRSILQNDKSLLIDSVYLLRMVHDVGKDKFCMFSSVKNMAEIANKEKMESDPVFGFKRDLIRLVGNLCYEHEPNQKQVREINGIELLLDCSPVDGKNPFISQWVVFAIRNVCIGNQENQAILYSISKTGKMDKKLLDEVGVQIEKL